MPAMMCSASASFHSGRRRFASEKSGRCWRALAAAAPASYFVHDRSKRVAALVPRPDAGAAAIGKSRRFAAANAELTYASAQDSPRRSVVFGSADHARFAAYQGSIMTRLLAGAGAIILLLAGPSVAAEMPTGATLQPDIAYGDDPAQRMDVYLPPRPERAPILLMVHGGGWRRGDKDNARVVGNKIARWLPKGVIFVSVDYRMMPDAKPLTQSEDVARALAKVQDLAPGWGGDPANIILMGHSAGAHLVALITAAPEIAAAQGAKPWKGAV